MTELRQRQPRLIDEGYLAFVRKQSCVCGCRRGPPCDAHHIRPASLKYDKPFTGRMKPDDKWCLPLLHEHHMALHAHGDELGWWAEHGIKDPFALAVNLYARYGGDGGQPKRSKTRVRKIGKTAARKSGVKRKIPSRPFSKQRRSMRP